MAFDLQNFNRASVNANSDSPVIYTYRTSDASATYAAAGYFDSWRFDLNVGDIIMIFEVGSGTTSYWVTANGDQVTIEAI